MSTLHRYSSGTRLSASVLLRQAFELWRVNPAQGALALNADGLEVSTDSPSACRFCALGALARAFGAGRSNVSPGTASWSSDVRRCAGQALVEACVARDARPPLIWCDLTRGWSELLAEYNDRDDDERLTESDWIAAIEALGDDACKGGET